MNVSVEEIKNIAPGELKLFPCEDGGKVKSARSLVGHVKETCMPQGVVDYEYKKFSLEIGLVFAIRALREGEVKILNA